MAARSVSPTREQSWRNCAWQPLMASIDSHMGVWRSVEFCLASAIPMGSRSGPTASSACEYVFGPSFTLSESDLRAFDALLVSPNHDSELSGMQPIGWYQSHTRSDVFLSEKELHFYQRYFPEMWQVALVLRPNRFGPVRAGFFFREPDGSVQAASSRDEFDIEPVPAKPVERLLEDGAAAETTPVPVPPAPVVSRPRRRWAWIATPIAVTLAAVLLWNIRTPAPADLTLRALDMGGQLRIDWNHASRVIQQSRSGAIEIEDGTYKVHNELSQEDLRSGSITYLRNTGHVQVSLVVRGTDRGTQTAVLRFSGSPPVTKAVRPSQPEPEKDVQPAEQPAEPVERPANRTLRVVHATTENAPSRITPSSPARRSLVLPPAGAVHATEPLLPSPPRDCVEHGAANRGTRPSSAGTRSGEAFLPQSCPCRSRPHRRENNMDWQARPERHTSDSGKSRIARTRARGVARHPRPNTGLSIPNHPGRRARLLGGSPVDRRHRGARSTKRLEPDGLCFESKEGR